MGDTRNCQTGSHSQIVISKTIQNKMILKLHLYLFLHYQRSRSLPSHLYKTAVPRFLPILIEAARRGTREISHLGFGFFRQLSSFSLRRSRFMTLFHPLFRWSCLSFFLCIDRDHHDLRPGRPSPPSAPSTAARSRRHSSRSLHRWPGRIVLCQAWAFVPQFTAVAPSWF